MVLEFVSDGRQRSAVRLNRVEIGLRRAEAHVEVFAPSGDGLDILDLHLGGAAAVVADAEEAHRVLNRLRLGGQRRLDLRLVHRRPAGIRAGDAEGEHAAAVRRLPPEGLRGQFLFVRAGAHKDVIVQPAFAEDLGQRAGVAEAVHAIGDARFHAQVFLHIRLAQQHLPDKRFPMRQVHIRLDHHAVDYMPAPLADELLDLRKERRVLLLDPLVDLRLAA